MKTLQYLLCIIPLMIGSSYGQINLVVTDFSNNSDIFFLDSWERSVPDLLRSEFAQTDQIVVLERDKLDKLFEEQKLALAGFADSAATLQIGQLAGAEFIISGSVDKIGKHYRIAANITRVKTGEVHIEKVVAPDPDHLKEMIDLLSGNIIHHLTGKREYKESISIANYPTFYFFAATVGFTAAALVYNQKYLDNKKKYDSTLEFNKFDSYYDKANNAHKVSLVMASLGGTALFGTLYCWIKNKSKENITADNRNQVTFNPGVIINPNKKVQFSVQIHF
jgi:TolB-like protein